MKPHVFIKSITFSDGTAIPVVRNEVMVIVGPNNSGKSAALRGIWNKFGRPEASDVVIKELSIEREGSTDDLIAWLESTALTTDRPDGYRTYAALGNETSKPAVLNVWNTPQVSLNQAGLAGFFCQLLTAETRLYAASAPANISLLHQPPQHPIHYLQRDDILEASLSKKFRTAFGSDLIVHRNAGNQVPLYTGQKPKIKEGQDRVSLDYVRDLEKLPQLQEQGDGMRSFAGILLYTAVAERDVILIDEPEAFLHPPQARLLGRTMALESRSSRQLFIATHSGDVLRGVLDSNSSDVRVVRLRRAGSVNIARELDNSQIQRLWSDPLLRYSNVLDGLFHEKIVLCESDADCRFYNAIVDTLFDEDKEGSRKPDVMFTHCGGKDRMPLVVRALTRLEVPITVVADFDVLREERPLRDILEAAGGPWEGVAADWKEVKQAVDAKKPELSTDEVRTAVEAILSKISQSSFPNDDKNRIEQVLRRSSPWSTAKSVGSQYVPSGRPTQALARILATLKAFGIFVVPVGELEGFAKSVGGHGPKWVNGVLQKDLATDSELQPARSFVAEFMSDTPTSKLETCET